MQSENQTFILESEEYKYLEILGLHQLHSRSSQTADLHACLDN